MMYNENRTVKSITIWGDSLGKGVAWNAERQRHVPLSENAVNVISRNTGIPINNRCRFGFTATRGLELLKRDLDQGLTCDVAVLEFGGNDCDFDWKAISERPDEVHGPAVEPDTFRKTLIDMVGILLEKGIRPILVTMPPIDAERYFCFFIGNRLNPQNVLKWLGDIQQIYRFQEFYSSLIRSVAEELHCTLLDIRSMCLANRSLQDLICDDGIHLNRAGQIYLGESVSNLILDRNRKVQPGCAL